MKKFRKLSYPARMRNRRLWKARIEGILVLILGTPVAIALGYIIGQSMMMR